MAASDIDLSGEGLQRPRVPTLPPTRTFVVVRPGTANDSVAMANEIVEAHQVEITSHGDLLFFVLSFFLTPEGYQPNSQMRRAFAEGQWLDVKEEMLLKSSILYN